MIVCHEGLPGSGKSYEAVVKHILPAIKSKRFLATNINGIKEGIPKFSELTDLSEKAIEELIYVLTDDDIENFGQNIPKDALIVFDEVQNYYPAGRQKQDPKVVKFVAEHRHHGHDIIIMTQSFNDIAPLWRRRTQRKISFFKRTAIGQPHKYTWIAYEATQPEKFKKINSGGGEYDSKYFGTYKSHQDGTENKSLSYEDDRTNIFKQKHFVFGVPLVAIGAIYAVYHLYSFFHSTPEVVENKVIKTTTQQVTSSAPVQQKVTKQVEEITYSDYFDEVGTTYTLHLSATIANTEGVITHGIVQALDSHYNLKEQFSLEEIKAFGWSINQKEFGLIFSKQARTHLARPFPRSDLYGRINETKRESL